MDLSGDRDPLKQSPTSKQAKRCVQSKLPWAVSPRLNGVSAHSPPLSPSAMVKVVEKGVKSSVERTCQGRKRNSRMKSLDKAFEEESIRFNARMEAHSFSSLQKATKRPTEISRYFTGGSSPDLDGDYSDLFPPVHVFEALNDNVVMPDWRNWKFLETNSVNLSSHCSLENFSSLFEGSVEHLKMESACMEEDLDLSLLTRETTRDSTVGVTSSSKFSSGLASMEHLSSPLKMVHVGNHSLLPPACNSCVDNPGQNVLHKRRLASYHQRNHCFPDCDLWTDKYRPENASEVCGNAESVKFLSEWLKSWYETGTVKKCSANEDNGGASYNNDHYMDKTYSCNTLKNALLIAGPIGIGKSSAVYACAREQGFKVIEVNASSLRNGAYLRQTFGEAVDSLGLLHWLVDDQFQTSKPMLELLSPLPVVTNNEFQVDANEMGSKKGHEINATGNKSAPSQVANKTLLLFEEVDIVFNEDHGFISTILKLAEITKRPIILTSNKRKSFLPQLLNRLTVLEFKAPSYQELLCHVSMVCTFERVSVSCSLLEHIIYACLCDIRRILMLLQFWCQGMRYDTDHRIQSTKICVPFDIDAVHLAISKIIPWDFHCELSEKLENEICRTISTVNENESLVGIAMQRKLSSKGNFDPWVMNSFVNGQRSLHNHKELSSHIDNLEILFDDSYTPLSSSQRLFHQKYDIALSSPSKVLPTSPITLTSPTHEFHGILPIAPIEKSFNSFEEASISHVCDTYDIHNVSCVPQSSLASEDETDTTSFLSGAVSNKQGLPSFLSPNRFTCIRPEVYLTNSDERTLEASKFNRNAAFSLESIQGNEDPVGFENEVKYESSHFQLINDESSRAGFSVRSALKERFVCSQEVTSVPEAWRKFRSFCGKYKPLLASNSKHASSVASVTSKLADLISEMDFIHQSCNFALCESLEPTATFRVEYGSKSCYDTRIDMGFTFAQHGFCFYMMKCATFGSRLGRNCTVDVSEEVLASSTNSVALGMLLTHKKHTGHISSLKILDVKTPKACILIEREPVAIPVAELYGIILRVVPIRLSMVPKGHAFHEYLSFLMHISRLVASLPVESWEHKPKRRTSLHHLSSCARHFTSEQMELLARSFRVCSSSSSIL